MSYIPARIGRSPGRPLPSIPGNSQGPSQNNDPPPPPPPSRRVEPQQYVSNRQSLYMGEPTNVDFLLPTGMMVTLACYSAMPLADLKSAVWQEARNFPLYELMKDMGFYSFLGVTKDGNKDEFVNESQTLEQLHLHVPLLKLVERQGDMDEKMLNAEIGALIDRKLADFDLMEAEVQDCRRHWLNVSEEAVNTRQMSPAALASYNYSAVLVSPYVHPFNKQDTFNPIISYTDASGRANQINSVSVRPTNTPAELVMRIFSLSEVRRAFSRYQSGDVCLKMSGSEEYLLEKVELYRYKFINKCLESKSPVRLVLLPREVISDSEVDRFIRPVHGRQQDSIDRSWKELKSPFMLSQATLNRFEGYISSWQVKETYCLKVLFAKNCNISETMKVYVRAMLYHGEDALCDVTATMKGANPEKAEWNEVLEFDVPIIELPRSAKLCFLIYQKRQAGRSSKADAPIAWVNLNVFDYAGVLVTGRYTLYTWPFGDEHESHDLVNYIGTTVLNPDHSGCLQLTVELLPKFQGAAPVLFPSDSEVEMFARQMAEGANRSGNFPKTEMQTMQKLIQQDPLSDLDEMDKELIWKMRYVCMDKFPQALPKVLESLAWSNRCDVSQVYLLLSEWKSLSPETAMELLDYKYADISVRAWAVRCLEKFTDDEVMMFLLQLVQVLKFEPYLDCPLAEFLLRRGLRNKAIGHYLFWHLRAEMHVPSVSVRYGLMLEAYCRGCGQYRKALLKQIEALGKLEQLTGELQKIKKAKSEDMKPLLSSPNFLKSMLGLRSPLFPSIVFDELIPDKCKVLDSKMRPLWLVYDNHCKFGDKILHIFKNGDDLRQDMLTLQVMGIMDHLWKTAGIDLKMCTYSCLSMGDQIGLIDVVLSSSTIAKIQKQAGGARGAFDKKILYTWLKSKNPNPSDFHKAVENFTLSCAGCCVATYVLGIGDRHSDNIMLKENGQLVHIDFGHFLGNFKSKFGVKRERVPFVLTDDFIYIITMEGTRDSPEFAKFQKMCEKAFMLLRDKGNLFINLFTMMLSTGIPELRTVDDIHYISNALCLSKSDDQALEDFRKKMQEAVKHSYSVSWNWFLHNVARSGN